MNSPGPRNILRGLCVSLAALALSGGVVTATPYATCLTNNAGVVSFRLNEGADTVRVVWNGGASVTNLGARARGLTVTNIGATSPFFVQVAKTGNNIVAISNTVAFNSPRGVAVNYNPKSPNFGRIFVGNTAAGTKGQGIYVHQSDMTDIFGAARTGGITFGSGGSAPWRLTVGEDDDLLYASDWTDNKGNLYVIDQDGVLGNYALQALGPCLDGTLNAATDGGSPVTTGNNHGSVANVAVWGSTNAGNLTIMTVDEDLQDDRMSTTANQMNSVWRYDLGSSGFPCTFFINDPNPLTNRLITPNIDFVSNVEGLCHGANGYLYFSQGRANGNEPGIYVLTNMTPAQFAWNDANVWNSWTASRAMGLATDFFTGAVAVSVSRDGRWVASFDYQNNRIKIARLTNGIPDLGRVLTYTGLGTTGSGRDIAWDAANNLIYSSSGLGNVYQISLGLSGTNTTGSDGTFVSSILPVVSVAATTNLAHRTDINGNFTIYRDGDLSAPLTVNLTLGGTAVNGTDYQTLPTSVTFLAGVASTNVTVVPLPSTKAMPPVTVVLTLSTSTSKYNLVEGRSATVVIADNQTPLLSLNPVYTNMYERLATDFIRYTVSRLGETNVSVLSYFTNGGTALMGSDYNNPNMSISMNPGVTSLSFDINPYPNYTAEGPLSIVLGIAPDTAVPVTYNITNAVATFTLIDSDLPAETVLWQDNFDSYAGITPENTTPSGWKTVFGCSNSAPDYSFTFGYDYNSDQVPAAPGTGGSTYGLKATVNKYDATGAAAALNFYPVGQSFSSNYAVRFNMLLMNGGASGTEHAIFGINHSGTKTNWNRSGGFNNSYATNQDGLWFGVNAVGGNSWDYSLWSGATGTAATAPALYSNRLATATTQVFKNNGTVAGGPYAANGCPGVATNATAARNWVDVEIAQTPNMVVLKMNNQVIIATTNITPYTSGNVMLGYNDMFDSIGPSNNPAAGVLCAAVYYDNLRVIRIAAPTILTQPANVVAGLGAPAGFSVTASTTTSTTNYQWFLNNAPIAGATSRILNLGSVASTNYGTYYVVVDDGTYPVQSASATLTAPAPIINVPPADRIAVVGSSPSFSVVATTYSGTTNYQWMYYGTNLVGGTAATYTRTNVQLTSFNGPYTVRVSDGMTSVTSTPPATLIMAVSPGITGPVKVPAGLAFSFNTEVGPNYVIDFKSSLTNATWLPLSTNIGTGAPLTVTNTMTGAEGYYRVRLQ